MRRLVRLAFGLLAALALLALGVAGLLYWQARQMPEGRPDMVALGSSFAAGIGLGPRAPGSPYICMRTANGYPGQLARMTGRALVDMSCSGTSSRHVLRGGFFFLGPQVDAIRPDTQLVTLTIGGNDIGYVGDLSLLAARRQGTLTGWLARSFTRSPDVARARDYGDVGKGIAAIVAVARQRAPKARIIVISYPHILPPAGTCAKLQLAEIEVAAMRRVGDRLAAVTGAAARASGATFIDMHALGADHHACAAEPWVNGWQSAGETPFHPTRAGAEAMARANAAALKG